MAGAIQEILVTIILDDGERVQGSISAEGSSRWGNDVPHLGACVEPMEAMRAAVADWLTPTAA